MNDTISIFKKLINEMTDAELIYASKLIMKKSIMVMDDMDWVEVTSA